MKIKHPHQLLPGLCIALLIAHFPFGAAQAKIPKGYDDSPIRVMQIMSVYGDVGVLRDGKIETLRSGIALLSKERLLAKQNGRASLRLGRFGHLDFVSTGRYGALVLEKLPSSSWAADLSTTLRVNSGALHLRWQRPSPATKDWPLLISVGAWTANVSSGEHLFRSRGRRGAVCNVVGEIELSGEGFRKRLEPGHCLILRAGYAPEVDSLNAKQWSALLHKRPSSDAEIELSRGSATLVAQPEEQALLRRPTKLAPSTALTRIAPAKGGETGAVPRTEAFGVPTRPFVQGGSEWIINVMTLSNRENANKHMEHLIAQGHPASIRAEKVRGRMSYRIVLEGIGSGREAQHLVGVLKAEMGYESAWALQKR